jgi:hypothetical protein
MSLLNIQYSISNMFDDASDILPILIAIVALFLLWKYYTNSNSKQVSYLSVPEVRPSPSHSIKTVSSITDNEVDNDTDVESEIIGVQQRREPDLIRVPRAKIIRQPFPVGEPALSFTQPTFLSNEEIAIRYGDQLPFSNPPPPNGPAFAGGYGPPEVPRAGAYMAEDATIERVFPELT